MKENETINLTVADLRRAHDSVSCSTAKQVIKALKPEAFEEEHSIGQHFMNGADEYLLTGVGSKLVLLVNINRGTHWGNPFKVKNPFNITESEWMGISGGNFKLKKP